MNMSLYYLVQERLLNNGIISVNADGTKVKYGHSAAGYVKCIVQLRGNGKFVWRKDSRLWYIRIYFYIKNVLSKDL